MLISEIKGQSSLHNMCNYKIRGDPPRVHGLLLSVFFSPGHTTPRLDHYFTELEVELSHIKWSTLGLSEVRRQGEDTMILDSEHLFYFRKYDELSRGGVGFLVHKILISNVVEVSSVSTRVAYLNGCSYIHGDCTEIAYYSEHPPCTPLYFLPFPSSILSTRARSVSRQQLTAEYKKEAKTIVQHVLRLILRSVTRVIVNDVCDNVKDVSVGSSVHIMSQNVATQTGHMVLENRYIDDEDVNSSKVVSRIELDSKWIKDLRSLRNSHVRLVLRQLQQLQDIERINRILCCTSSPQTNSSSCQIDRTVSDEVIQ